MKTDLPSQDAGPGVVPLPGEIASRESGFISSVVIGGQLVKVPSILLEGDDPEPENPVEDAHKFSPGQEAPSEQAATEEELPESYGTQKLLLTARDPHWLYAHWDFSQEQQREHCGKAVDEDLFLRLHRERISETPVSEVRVNPDSRHWFVHVDRPGASYIAELGYSKLKGQWTMISTSGPAATPPVHASQSTSAEFATIPFDVPLEKLDATLAALSAAEVAAWTAGQERLIEDVMGHPAAPAKSGSPAIADLLAHPLDQDLAAPTSPGGISSPAGGWPPNKRFWFNLNTELILYGATEADALVSIGGQPIQLRSDGSFSFRFALPDGNYELPVVAVSADQTDGRAAGLKFSRETQLSGEVGAHPQNPELKTPAPGNP